MCNEALSLSETYGGALLQRSKVYLYYLGNHWQELSADDRLRYADWALDDSYRCSDLYPEWTMACLTHCQNIIYQGRIDSDPMLYRVVIEATNQRFDGDWLRNPPSDDDRSFAFNLRAQCHHFLGQMEQAEKDYTESILLPINRAGTSTALNSGTRSDVLSWRKQTESKALPREITSSPHRLIPKNKRFFGTVRPAREIGAYKPLSFTDRTQRESTGSE